ncbi:AAA family ATPase [Sphingobacterium thalpophilum]|uniref:Predicted ATP-binding protein involved in virulence n=1 Tax=Sphingobacterium thalpophilum TaxID=259 RepID=A0A4U9VRQ2_9SPHI|nr:ATP-binding protein [Sphingobacterium thalpophilum]VTR49153.1 Predicted ATP-binding protein involved in virulence [Sphingobacterium thalpophilum]
MELIYLWIESFRNIDRQGFNFSNQYDIYYNEVTNEITVDEIGSADTLKNENGILNFGSGDQHYLKDFFHPNISNITAIIGKNSSGKSNVIDFILTAISRGNRSKLTSNYVLVFKKDNQPLFFGRTKKNSLETSILSFQGTKLKKINPDDEWESMFYTNVADNKDYIFEDGSVHNFSFKTLNKLQSNKIKFVSSSIFNDTWIKLSPDNQDSKKVRFIFNPIAYTSLESQNPNDEKILGILKRYRRAIYHASTSNYNRFKYGVTINLLSFIIVNENDVSPLLEKIEIVGTEGLAEAISSLNTKVSNFLIEFNDYTNLGELLEGDFKLYQQLLRDMSANNNYNFGEVEKHVNSIIVDFNEDFMGIISGKTEIFNTQTLISHDWSQLSSGMKAYLNLFSQLFYLADQAIDKSKNLLICIDEGDLYLHPEWQRNFLNDFITFVTNIFDTTKIQVILTSHSPFLISDLPKESVLLLNEIGESTRQLIDESSFGANIHQLFTNQFFLNKGSIGLFAKTKIQTLLRDIPNMIDENVDQYRKRIEMIGEPILRYRLDEVFRKRIKELSKEKQIEWHQQQIYKLKEI